MKADASHTEKIMVDKAQSIKIVPELGSQNTLDEDEDLNEMDANENNNLNNMEGNKFQEKKFNLISYKMKFNTFSFYVVVFILLFLVKSVTNSLPLDPSAPPPPYNLSQPLLRSAI